MQFSPCRGGESCTQGGTHCEGCGRSHEEIAKTRELVASLVDFGLEMGYENYDEFTRFIGEKAAKRIAKAKSDQALGGVSLL
ncbi:MAG: DUF1289 domain-containing protein [Gammaproteobacteria bacterium]|nr:DUF1289 domain-containing protein [Gammaproteobacteria bacterium]